MTGDDWLPALALAMMCGGLSSFGWRFWLGLNGKAGLLRRWPGWRSRSRGSPRRCSTCTAREADPMTETGTTPAVSGPNPHRVGACPECGSYRADGLLLTFTSPAARMRVTCSSAGGCGSTSPGSGGPPLYCTDPSHDHGRLTP